MRKRQNPVNHPDKPKPAPRSRSKHKKEFYAQPAPAPASGRKNPVSSIQYPGSATQSSPFAPLPSHLDRDIVHHPHAVPTPSFTLREDWSIESEKISAGLAQMSGSTPQLIFRDDSRGIFLYSPFFPLLPSGMQGYVILAIVIVGGAIALYMDFNRRHKYDALRAVNPGVEYPNNHHGLISHERTHRSQKSFTTRGPLETLSRDPSQRT